MSNIEIIELIEYQTISLQKDKITEEAESLLVNTFKNQLILEPPWLKTLYQWRITSQGWIGYIPINDTLGISLKPKVPLKNLFWMLTYAYKLKSIEFLDGSFKAESIQGFFEYLANKLSHFVLNRNRKGIYREYFSEQEELSYICGRINLTKLIKAPWNPRLEIDYQNYSADIKFNQIIIFTLDIIARSGFCSNKVLALVSSAYRALCGYASLKHITAKDCLNILYNRLNDDYKPIHILCRFFIEHMGPTINVGDHTMIPFLVNMSQLFELFVAEWLQANLPNTNVLIKQFRYYSDPDERIFFELDMVIKEKSSGKILYVLDTKYKRDQEPKPDDIAQVVAYAHFVGCKETIIIYPVQLINPYSTFSDDIRIRCLSFDLADDLQTSGNNLLQKIYS